MATHGAGDVASQIYSPGYNPFKIPKNCDVVALLEKERKLKQRKRESQRKAPVHKKLTNATRISQMTAQTRKVLKDDSVSLSGSDSEKDWTKETTKDHPFGKEGIVEYINRKREMFLVKYAICVKREEMRKLEKLAREEELQLVQAEKALHEDAELFDQFLKQNDRDSVDAITAAEIDMRRRLDKISRVKKLTQENRVIRFEMFSKEEKLLELKMYQSFIDEVASLQTLRGTLKNQNKSEQRVQEEEPTIKFDEPEELLVLFEELEDQNLSLIQNGQDLEESMEELKCRSEHAREKLTRNIKFLIEQVALVERSAEREEEKTEDFKFKCEMFSFGNFDSNVQKKMLTKYGAKVENVYSEVIGNNEAHISTLQMLTSIENKFGRLLDMQETLPEEALAEFEKKLDKDRRARLREEKLKNQEALQKERVARALERSQAAPKIHTGRRPVRRSAPLARKENKSKKKDQSLEQQEYLQKVFFEK